jgi:copper chaperone CopZ
MTHKYSVKGMTCSGCQAKVQSLLSAVPAVMKVSIDLPQAEATIEMDRHVSTRDLQAALKDYPKYHLNEIHPEPQAPAADAHTPGEAAKSWLSTYKPILLVFAYILAITILTSHDAKQGMQHFMAAFFLTFSFFKMLDIPAFADSYSTYDILAARWRGWGFIYPFAEVALGIGYLTGFNPLVINPAAFLIMGLSIIGVLRSVLKRRAIRCACLGAVFNLPMSTITIIEDGLMIAMSAIAIVTAI